MALFDKKNEAKSKRALLLAATYGSVAGREVFKDMILQSGMFQSIDSTDPEAIPRHNIMAATLYEMGILTDDNLEKIVDSLLNLCYKE